MQIKNFVTYFLLLFSLGCMPHYARLKTSPSMDQDFEARTWQGRPGNINKYTPWTSKQIKEKAKLREFDILSYKKNMLELINDYLARHPNIEGTIKEHLLALQICEGMNKEQVKLLLPSNKYSIHMTNKYGANELWVYQSSLCTHHSPTAWHLYFEDDILIRLEIKWIKLPL